MPTARKESAVQELRDRLATAKSLFLTDYQGLTVDEITKRCAANYAKTAARIPS